MVLSRLFDAEPGVYTDNELHELDEQDLVDMRDKLEDEGDMVGCNTADEILKSRARQATRFYARRIIGRGHAMEPATADERLQAYPTRHSGHCSNQLGEILEELGEFDDMPVTGARLLVSRMTRADGALCDRAVEVLFRMGGNWVLVSPRGS